jgi:hypothetical protein
MAQLSLLSEPTGVDLDSHLAHLCERASARGVPEAHVSRAARATRTRFIAWSGEDLSEEQVRRSAAYFNAVVRRAIITSPDQASREAYRRLLVRSISADLIEAGWPLERAAEEARRLVGGDTTSDRVA